MVPCQNLAHRTASGPSATPPCTRADTVSKRSQERVESRPASKSAWSLGLSFVAMHRHLRLPDGVEARWQSSPRQRRPRADRQCMAAPIPPRFPSPLVPEVCLPRHLCGPTTPHRAGVSSPHPGRVASALTPGRARVQGRVPAASENSRRPKTEYHLPATGFPAARPCCPGLA